MRPVTEDEAAALIALHHAEERIREQAREARADFWTEALTWTFVWIFGLACAAGALYGFVKFIKWAWES